MSVAWSWPIPTILNCSRCRSTSRASSGPSIRRGGQSDDKHGSQPGRHRAGTVPPRRAHLARSQSKSGSGETQNLLVHAPGEYESHIPAHSRDSRRGQPRHSDVRASAGVAPKPTDGHGLGGRGGNCSWHSGQLGGERAVPGLQLMAVRERRHELRRMAEHQPGRDKPRWEQGATVTGTYLMTGGNGQVWGVKGGGRYNGLREVA